MLTQWAKKLTHNSYRVKPRLEPLSSTPKSIPSVLLLPWENYDTTEAHQLDHLKKTALKGDG